MRTLKITPIVTVSVTLGILLSGCSSNVFSSNKYSDVPLSTLNAIYDQKAADSLQQAVDMNVDLHSRASALLEETSGKSTDGNLSRSNLSAAVSRSEKVRTTYGEKKYLDASLMMKNILLSNDSLRENITAVSADYAKWQEASATVGTKSTESETHTGEKLKNSEGLADSAKINLGKIGALSSERAALEEKVRKAEEARKQRERQARAEQERQRASSATPTQTPTAPSGDWNNGTQTLGGTGSGTTPTARPTTAPTSPTPTAAPSTGTTTVPQGGTAPQGSDLSGGSTTQ